MKSWAPVRLSQWPEAISVHWEYAGLGGQFEVGRSESCEIRTVLPVRRKSTESLNVMPRGHAEVAVATPLESEDCMS